VVHGFPAADHHRGGAREVGEHLGGDPAAQERVLSHREDGGRAGHLQPQLHQRHPRLGQQVPYGPVVDARRRRENQAREPRAQERTNAAQQPLGPLRRIDGVKTRRDPLIRQAVDPRTDAGLERPEERREMGRMHVRQADRLSGEHLGHPVGAITQPLGLGDNPLPRLLAHLRLARERLVDRAYRHVQAPGQLGDRDPGHGGYFGFSWRAWVSETFQARSVIGNIEMRNLVHP
jgi:hypothetical protein